MSRTSQFKTNFSFLEMAQDCISRFKRTWLEDRFYPRSRDLRPETRDLTKRLPCSRPLFLRCKPPHQPSGLMVSVHGGTHDAAGIPGTFSGGIQAPAVYRLTVFPPQDPYWCRSPGLHPDHQPLGAESGELPFKIPQPVLQGFRHKAWQDLPQVGRDQSRPITGMESPDPASLFP